MTRLQSALQSLYLPHAQDGREPLLDEALNLIDADGQVRALMLALARPADWAALSVVWQSVQTELSWPAPAIAVSGLDGFQLWFSLETAVPVAEAHAFLDALRERYLGHMATSRVELMPALDDHVQPKTWPVSTLPVQQMRPGQWSAFVAPDLAPIFAETPWLDISPNPEGQADLLARLQPIKPMAWKMALAQLRPAAALMAGPSAPPPASAGLDQTAGHSAAKRFLRNVMNDDTVALALRIEAAKALLPYCE